MRSLLIAALATTSFGAVAQAQTIAADAMIEDGEPAPKNVIVVTAQKRAERLTDVPISITAATGEQLADAGVDTPADLVKIVPGLTYRPTDYGTPVYFIRGIGFNDIAIAVAPAVSVYVDEVPLPYSAMTSGATLDLERVEVLKGPQGTLFGQNSTGGAMNFIAANPTSTFEAGARFTYGRYNQNDIETYVSGPIADSLNGRIAVRREGRDGWQISQTRPDDRLGDRDFLSARMLLDWAPSEAVELQMNLNGWIDKSETQAAQFVRLERNPAGTNTDLTDLIAATYTKPAPENPRIADWGQIRPHDAEIAPGVPVGPSRVGPLQRDDNFFQASLRADIDLGSALTLSSITAYSKFNQDAPTDGDGVAFDDLTITIFGEIESVSQELRLAGSADRLNWMVGGNFSKDSTVDDQQGNYWGSNNSPGPVPIRWSDFTNSSRQKTRTYAGFASLDFSLTEDLSLYGSARYTKYRNRFNGCVRDTGSGELSTAFTFLSNALRGFTVPILDPNPGACATLAVNDLLPVDNVTNVLSEDNVSWRGGLDWQPDRDTLFYANVTRGFKAGSYPTVPGVFDDQFAPVSQEKVTAYEAGFKVVAFDRLAQITGAAFYYQYNDKQLIGFKNFPIFGPLPSLVQIPKSMIKGLELGLNATPFDGFTFGGGITYLDSRVDSSFVTSDPLGNLVDIEGEQFPITPKWQANATLSYTHPLSSAVDMTLGAGALHQSASPATFGSALEFVLPSYSTLDLRLKLEGAEHGWSAELWGRNVTNEFYVTSVTKLVDTVARTTGMGATYGITVGFEY